MIHPGKVTCVKNGVEITRTLDRMEINRRGTLQRIPIIRPGERCEWIEGDDRPHISEHEDF